MATKLELLAIRGERLQGMIDDLHKAEDCPEDIKLYWEIYGCEKCKSLAEEMYQDVFLKMPWVLRAIVNVSWFITTYITWPIQDVCYWILIKLKLRMAEPKGHQND